MSDASPPRARRALVIAPQPFYTPRGTPFSVYYRTLITAEQGIEIDLLTYGAGEDVAIEGVRIVRIPRFAWLGEIKVGPSALKAFLDLFLIAWTLGMLVRRRYDFVHAHEEAVFYCFLLKPLFRFKLIYDMHSSLPQQLTNFSFTSSRALIGIFERLERASIKAADAVITICPDLADYALGLIDDPGKHALIENSIFEPVRLSNPSAENSALPDVPLPENRPIVVYAGTLEPYQGIDLLLRAFAKAQSDVPEAFLLVVGGAPDQVAGYREMAAELGLSEDCLFTGRLPQAAARALVARASAQVSPRVRGTNTPLKVYEQLANGIPLVATDIHSHRQVLDRNVAFMAAPEPEPFARGIVAALCDAPARAARTTAARRLYQEKYGRDAYVAKLRGVLARVA